MTVSPYSSLEEINRRSQNIGPQHQPKQPGEEFRMDPEPDYRPFYPGVGKFEEKVVLISGGDSGIGRAVAVAFANEGALVAIIYKDEHEDAEATKRLVEAYGGVCLLIPGDVGDRNFCTIAVETTAEAFGSIDVLVNNAAEQHVQESLQGITEEQLAKTFRTNIFSHFFLTQAALPHIPEGRGCILNTTSVTAYKGKPQLMDYAATKGAIVTFTRSLAMSLAEKGIRVNGVAPGPIWTPLIPASFSEEQVAEFGGSKPLGRPAQPNEVAGCFTWLASLEASYMTGQILHPNGGTVVNG